ncbi:MAG: nucleotide exchange factor GrpE [Candidatus Brocadiaceae bacterium]|nr:nucleotide exchange factor GrpE [Candidatus Brocadiaceae bacterium]
MKESEKNGQPQTGETVMERDGTEEDGINLKTGKQFMYQEEMLVAQRHLLEELKSLMESRLAYDAAKEKAIDTLNEELKLYRDNFVFQAQRPLFIELILLYDNLMQLVNRFDTDKGLTDAEYSTIKNNILNIKDELLEILYRRDVKPFDEHPDALDYKLHKTVSTISTPIESENNTVEKIMKTGFSWNEKVLRPEEVVIKKYCKK